MKSRKSILGGRRDLRRELAVKLLVDQERRAEIAQAHNSATQLNAHETKT